MRRHFSQRPQFATPGGSGSCVKQTWSAARPSGHAATLSSFVERSTRGSPVWSVTAAEERLGSTSGCAE